MGSERRILVTEQGLPIGMSFRERLVDRIVFSSLARYLTIGVVAVFCGTNGEEISQFCRIFDNEKTILKVRNDFKEGKVRGLEVPANDPTVSKISIVERRRLLENYRLQRV